LIIGNSSSNHLDAQGTFNLPRTISRSCVGRLTRFVLTVIHAPPLYCHRHARLSTISRSCVGRLTRLALSVCFLCGPRGPLCGPLVRRLVARFASLFPATYSTCRSPPLLRCSRPWYLYCRTFTPLYCHRHPRLLPTTPRSCVGLNHTFTPLYCHRHPRLLPTITRSCVGRYSYIHPFVLSQTPPSPLYDHTLLCGSLLPYTHPPVSSQARPSLYDRTLLCGSLLFTPRLGLRG